MKKPIFSTIALLSSLFGFAQNPQNPQNMQNQQTIPTPQTTQTQQPAQTTPENCRCEDSFEWLKSTFETNDAGFGYIVERKGRAAYDLHNTMTLEKVKATENPSECTKLLREWLGFFRKGHIGLQPLFKSTPASPASTAASSAQSTQPVEPEIWPGDMAAFEKRVAAKQEADFEGVWELPAIKLGVIAEGEGYVGFVMESSNENLKRARVILKITRKGDGWQVISYMETKQSVFDIELVDKNHLLIAGMQSAKRLSPVFPRDPQTDIQLALYARTPVIEQFNPSTLYLRIPSFNTGQKADIDKVIADNFDKITSTENLIIDLRDNGGGGDGSWNELLPLIYTNPMRASGVSILSTPLNIDVFAKYLNSNGLSEEDRAEITAIVDKMKARPGEYVPMMENDMLVYTNDKVHEYPRNVGVIVNKNCASSTEQFLLTAKQSRKVKIFGVTTAGALDASNVTSIDSPDGRYRLRYATTISSRIPGMEIDDIGVQPDYHLDKSIPNDQWVDFVSDTLNAGVK
jgi:hypothetical protein